MNINKMSPRLQLALRYESLLSASARATFETGEAGRWQLIVRYAGNLDDAITKLDIRVIKISSSFMSINIPRNNINDLSDYSQVIFLSVPVEMSYIDIGLSAVCGTNIQIPTSQFYVTGKDVLVAIVDTGINYSYPDFINDNNTTRIKYLWDQTIRGNAPEGFNKGAEYTETEINNALNAATEEERLAIVPSEDAIGHGTALASIAAGNGRNNSRNRGVAPECELLIVKIGNDTDGSSRPRDVDVMEGISYVLQKAKEIQKPVSIILGVGDNLTGHDGQTALELYLDEAIFEWACNFSVGTGNEGEKGTHVQGTLAEGDSSTIELILQGNMTSYGCCLWKSFIDEIEIVVQAPNGESTDTLGESTSNRAYLFANTAVLISFIERSSEINQQEIFIWLQGQGNQTINEGEWRFIITSVKAFNGAYNMWAQITDSGSRFLNPSEEKTLTSPGTARNVTTVGALDTRTTNVASFSGRGYTEDGRVKPEVIAPGINIPVASNVSTTDYVNFSGTSAAAAFVGGAYALLLSYGLYNLNQPDFYGLRLRTYVVRNANRSNSYVDYPNNSWGYGILCIEATLSNMLDIATGSP